MSDSGRQFQSEMTPVKRLLAGLVGVGIVVVFGIAACLTPDPRGFGTHQQLGIPPCTFRKLAGVNCPHCGLTTSYSWFVRGQFQKSIKANPAGLILAVASIPVLVWSIIVSLRGSCFIIHEPGRVGLIGFAVWVLISIVIWAFRLIDHQN